MSELNEWLAHTLPVLGIDSAYLFMYTDSPSFSLSVRLIAHYDRKKKIRGNRKNIISLNSLFDEILSARKRRSYCHLPLLYKDEQYGLLAMEVTIQSSIAYDTLSIQIGNSINGTRLVEEVSDMNQKLEESNRLLRHANEEKTRFFINVAHETRTPLTLIQNYLERSIQRHASDPDLSIVKQNIDILLQNMLNLLDSERLEKGTMSFSHDSFIDLSESAQKKCALFRPVAATKNSTVNLTAEDDAVIKIDPWALDRILNNLLDNAVKYTQVGGKVWVKVKKNAGKAVLHVSDNGPGLSRDTISHLFEPYYQLEQKRSSKQGIGVGRSIVKKIIDDLNASISVSNNRRGGACFICEFTLSTKPSDKKHLENIPLTEPSVGIVFQENIEEEDISADKASILIVDDNVQMLVFSHHDESIYADYVLRAGALGYIMKDEEPEKIKEAIQYMLKGEIFVSEKIRLKLLKRLISNKQKPYQSPMEQLSSRELEVFQLIGTGLSTRKIASELNLGIKTIETYRFWLWGEYYPGVFRKTFRKGRFHAIWRF
jgi:signal transduction histidine kinase